MFGVLIITAKGAKFIKAPAEINIKTSWRSLNKKTSIFAPSFCQSALTWQPLINILPYKERSLKLRNRYYHRDRLIKASL